ncbi:hypothetical protein ACFSTC_50065 [Nonomuraea ferruginea]
MQSGSALSSDQQSEIRDALKDSKNDIYLAALPDDTVTDPAGYIKQLGDAVSEAKKSSSGGQWTVAVLDGPTLFAASNFGKAGMTDQLSKLAVRNNDDVVSGMEDFIARVNLMAEGKTRSALDSGPVNDGSGFGALATLGVLAVVERWRLLPLLAQQEEEAGHPGRQGPGRGQADRRGGRHQVR